MTGLPVARVVVLPLARLACCSAGDAAAAGRQVHNRWASTALGAGTTRSLASSAPKGAIPPAAAPPPPGTKPTAAQPSQPASKGTAAPPPPPGPPPAPSKARSSRLPALLLLVAPVAAYSTFDLYQEQLPEPVKPYALQAKQAADGWVQQGQQYIGDAVSGLWGQLREQLAVLTAPPAKPSAPVAAGPSSSAIQPTVSTSLPAPEVPAAGDGSKVISDLEEQAERIVQAVDATLLDQLLNEALVSDIDAASPASAAAAALLPTTTPDLEEAAQQLQEAPHHAGSEAQAKHQPASASGGVDADHHVPAAQDLLSSVAAELGVSVDLSPSGLVKNAEKINAGASESWQNFAAQHRQATADALAFVEALRQVKQFHAQELAQLQAQLEAAASKTSQVRKDAEEMAERFKGLLRLQQEQAIEDAKLAVHRAEQELLAAQAHNALQERRERLAALDAVRTQLNQVSTFAQAQVKHSLAASHAQQLFVNILHLHQALESGASLAQPVGSLRGSCRGDELAQAALQSLPRAERLPTGTELVTSLASMRRHVASLSYLPEGGGGILATAVAYLATSLKFEDASSESGAAGESRLSPDSAITHAQQLLLQGDLAGAAAAVEAATAGTAAASFVRPWVTQARDAAAARQAVQLLLAQTAVMMAAGSAVAA